MTSPKSTLLCHLARKTSIHPRQAIPPEQYRIRTNLPDIKSTDGLSLKIAAIARAVIGPASF